MRRAIATCLVCYAVCALVLALALLIVGAAGSPQVVLATLVGGAVNCAFGLFFAAAGRFMWPDFGRQGFDPTEKGVIGALFFLIFIVIALVFYIFELIMVPHLMAGAAGSVSVPLAVLLGVMTSLVSIASGGTLLDWLVPQREHAHERRILDE